MNKQQYQIDKVSELSIEKLRENIILLKKELFNLRFQMSLGELTNNSRFRIVRKGIARINTELSRRKKVGAQ